MSPAFKGGRETKALMLEEIVIHFRLADPFAWRHQVNDFWVMDQEAQLTITSRRHELPPGIVLHQESGDAHALWMQSMYAPEEVCPPNFWKVRAGDYLVIAGVAGESGDALTLLPFEENAVVYWHKLDGTLPLLLEGMAGPDSSDPRHVEILRRAAREVAGRPMLRSFATEWSIDS
jgi:hypothetical protein